MNVEELKAAYENLKALYEAKSKQCTELQAIITSLPVSEKVYNLMQACVILNKSYDQVRRMNKAGKFPNAYKTKCCGALIIPASDLQANL